MPNKPGEAYLNRERAKREALQKRWRKHEDKGYNKSRPEAHKFYYSPRWKKLRQWYRSGHPLCEACLKRGVVTSADLVDHIVPITDGGDPMCVNNLQALCHRCHNIKHAKERNKG